MRESEGRISTGAAAERAAPCLICGETEARLVVRAPDFEYQCRPGEWDLVECRGCGHVFIDPIPAPAEIGALYPSWYYTVNPKSPIYMEGPVVEAKMVKDAENLRRQLGERPIRSVVDIGGGNLTRLIKLKEVFSRGQSAPVDAVCLDLQFDAAVLRQAEAAGIRCVVGNVETDLAALRDQGHDLVIMRQLIEHLRDPRAALRQVHQKLSAQGVLVIDTPNRGGWDYRLFRRRYWGGYHIPRHFHLFSLSALARILVESGYRVERQGCTPSIAFWIISLRNALGLNSIERGRSIWELLNLKSLPVVGSFYVLDLLWSKLGGETSNQYVMALRSGR
ncbi:MAG: class I SAM-dependent methyltransferase [Verrucomicrobiales bacterium]|nr:class I SAM-dependent methyltransferase [Verrucomicrobiales bacterium]